MRLNNINSGLIKILVGRNLPDVHYMKDLKARSFGDRCVHVYKTFVIHPIKRRLAKYYLSILRKCFDIKVIGITGSAGKTSTKEMLSSILSLKGETIYSYANIDPVYNIPTTILKCRPSTKYLVLEMGVEYPGEMDFYLWLAKPNIAVITNINPTHLTYFKSVDNVYKEKVKLALFTGENDRVVLNREDTYLKKTIKDTRGMVTYFGKGTNVYSDKYRIKRSGSIYTLNINGKRVAVNLPIIGRHFVNNSLAAAAVAYDLGISPTDIKKGLENFIPLEHRMNIIELENNRVIIDDTYNNNPKAARETLKSFNETSKVYKNYKKGIVFGDMLELGEDSEKYHQEIGRVISGMDIGFIICVGKESNIIIEIVKKNNNFVKTYGAKDKNEAYLLLKSLLSENTLVLLKGSRSIGLDDVVEKLSQ
ncbi:MAG: UDP-N-acetylmuramoyl-tripeptide-D-alanyl-D-alanine ligase [Candidatus Woesebacteria bacterium GW2011_GWA1_38_8]|uniref:UDP-N-acetylmuramoyl-tripeptide--D-alanyl-D-alanine ligase n=1 Tax=Candidatus Woesebacteria bacterium GW2011_GWA1_38_8 TaxID=1618547 RepID=A0A0G0KYL9_9BACT|nr:MAG: UDP-N-acetylmuramoyl-tripeptide-D-alanyl-D-alanine ligase [Candidatus Woesebacteria bacterium GW2011_GWA1_38_8]